MMAGEGGVSEKAGADARRPARNVDSLYLTSTVASSNTMEADMSLYIGGCKRVGQDSSEAADVVEIRRNADSVHRQ